MNIIVFDTETTGLLDKSGDSAKQPHVCQFASITLDRNLVPIREIDKLIRPLVPIPKSASAINGITDEMVAGAPTFGEVVDEQRIKFPIDLREKSRSNLFALQRLAICFF